jgi:hypothetical protein
LTAVCATAFAYEGWVIATSINAELRDSKKNLPIALVAGAAIVIVVYILYYVGLRVWFQTQRSWKTVGRRKDRVLYVILPASRNIAVRVRHHLLPWHAQRTHDGMHARVLLACGPQSRPKAGRLSEISPKTNMATNSAALASAQRALACLFLWRKPCRSAMVWRAVV